MKRVLLFVYKLISPISYFSIKWMTHISIQRIVIQKILGFNRSVPWPVHFTSLINNPTNITLGEGSYPGFMPGIYIQANGKINIGKYCLFAPNVGIVSSNHSIYDIRKSEAKDIEIGDYCWIGMNSVVLPGVKLGKHTIVGANSVVTKSFEEGYCVVAGNPAKIIKRLDRDKCVSFRYETPYIGFKKSRK